MSGSFWASIDPATKSGLAVWRGTELDCVKLLRPIGNNGKHVTHGHNNSVHMRYDCRADALLDIASFCKGGIVVERGGGRFAAVVRSQGRICGAIETCCEIRRIPYVEINVSEWRRVIKEGHDVSFPHDSKRCKELSVKLVKEMHGIDVTDDEADAVLIGVAAMRMRVLPWM